MEISLNKLTLETGTTNLSIYKRYEKFCERGADRSEIIAAAVQLNEMLNHRMFEQKIEWLRTLVADANKFIRRLLKDQFWCQVVLIFDNGKRIILNDDANGGATTSCRRAHNATASVVACEFLLNNGYRFIDQSESIRLSKYLALAWYMALCHHCLERPVIFLSDLLIVRVILILN